ncbi:MAG: hypothetical protein B7Y78_13690 [Caulobacter sp. 35-67-4]|nr:MAG: hypothetical protein B7Y78_13690 [Caulobacter sp. 35-67-4]
MAPALEQIAALDDLRRSCGVARTIPVHVLIETPRALREAWQIAALPHITSAHVRTCVETHSKAAWRKRRYFRLLNRMLFKACAPDQRYKVLERFYRLGGPLIQRFYAARLTPFDKARVLMGKPPVPIVAALGYLGESSVIEDKP